MSEQELVTKQQIVDIFIKHSLPVKGAITQINNGFTNEVYSFGDNIIKVCSQCQNIGNMAREAFFYQKLAKNIPTSHLLVYDNSQSIINRPYIIIKRAKGQALIGIWHKLSIPERQSIIKQLCLCLKEINRTDFSILKGSPFEFETSTGYWRTEFRRRISSALADIQNRSMFSQSKIELIKDYIDRNTAYLDFQNLQLVYWDVHFNNIFIDEKCKITALLDFDSLEVASADYVLRLVRDLSRLPHRYARPDMRKLIIRADYSQLLKWYQEFYPELFDFPHLKQRLDIYQLYDDLLLARDYPDNKRLHRRILYLVTAGN